MNLSLSLNLGTAAFFTALVEFALGMGMLILWMREGKRYLACWGSGFLSFGLGSLLISARNKLPDFLTIILANFGTTLSSVLLYVGICLFFDRRRSWMPWGVLALEAAWLAYYTYAAYDTSARVYVYSVAQALIVLATLRALFEVGGERAGRSSPEVVVVTLLLLVVHLARIAGTPFFPLPRDFLISGNFQTLLSFGLLMIHASYALALGNMHASALNADLNDALIEAKTKERQKIEVLSYIGHDLRAPLATISGYSELLLNDARQEQHRLLRTIQRSVKYQMDLIDELPEYAKSELRPMAIQPAAIDLVELLKNISEYAEALCLQKNNRFYFQAIGGVPRRVEVDGRRLQQVLLNLLSNAAKFTRDGRITLTVEVRCGEKICALNFAVIDTGIGIDWTENVDIFSAFQKIQAASGGTGLGLFIAQRIALAMNGSLQVTSIPEQGSTFSFELSAPIVDATQIEWPAMAQPGNLPSTVRPARLVMPDRQVRRELAELALVGRFSDIERWIECHAQEAAYAPFAAQLRDLLDGFDFAAIHALALRD